MFITLEDILCNSKYSDLKIIAGKNGLSREINSVTILDAPDGYKWTKGGEFVISSGYVLKNEPKKLTEIISALNELGASAFGIKLNRYLKKIPKDVIDKAEELDFPLISIPDYYPFKEIINHVLNSIINKQNEKLVFSTNIHKNLTKLVLEGCDEKEIILTLEDLIDKPIIFYNKIYDEFYYGKLINERIYKNKEFSDLKMEFQDYSLKIDNKYYGSIFVDFKGDFNEYDEIALEHAATVLELKIQKRISNDEIESRYRDEFVRDLIYANIKSEAEVFQRGKLYNWNFKSEVAVMIVDIDNFKENYTKMDIKENNNSLEELKRQIFSKTKRVLRNYLNNIIFTSLSDKIIFLVQKSDFKFENQISLKLLGDKIRRKIKSAVDFSVTVGIGDFKKSVLNIEASFEEAKKAIQISRIIHGNDYTSLYNSLGAYRLLDSIYQDEKADNFILSYLGKLLEYESVNDVNLLASLKELIKNDWNMKETSKKLYIHYNTMKYRTRKIEEILEVDLNKSEVRFNLNLALKLLDIKNEK